MKNLTNQIQTHFNKMVQTSKLFRVEMTGSQIWDLYLKSLESDAKFRDPLSSTHNCNHCKNFIRRYGNIVSVDENYNIISIFDVGNIDIEYKKTLEVLSKAIKESKITDVFFETYEELNKLNYEKCNKSNDLFRLGVAQNHKKYTQEEVDKYGVVNTSEVYTFNHFHLDLPAQFVNQSGKSVQAIMSDYRDAQSVFLRAMQEIPLDTLNLVKDLINQGSLLDGQTHLYKIEQFITLKQEYDNLSYQQRDSWTWSKSYQLPFAKFKNELIGVLCSELAEGEELNKACQAWNKRVDPANYMKVTAPITQKQIEEAKQFVEDNGYTNSFDRRFATIDDIKVTEILHSNVGNGEIKKISIFDNVKATSTRHKRNEFDGVEEVSIEKFMSDVLPSCTSVEVYLENRLESNLASLTTANIPESKKIFKWNNNYSWTFNGNLAGKSQIKEEVKNKGGKVDGALRFSMMWADGDGDDSDLDLHCITPDNTMIYFSNKSDYVTGGNLDIDIQRPNGSLAVENITFPTLTEMLDGVYKLFIRQYANRGSKGFKAEVEFDGELYSYSFDKPVFGDIQIAEVTLENGQFSIIHKLPATNGLGVIREIYGLETNQFHKVKIACLSPNHWSNNNTGNKHYFFMLDNCKANMPVRSFHNENLNSDLLIHKRVIEVLATTNMLESSATDNQLSGLGFNSTVKDELIVKLQGSHKRIIKIKF